MLMKNLFTSRGTDNRLLSTLLMLLVALWTVPHYSNAMNVQAPDGEDECVLDLKTAGLQFHSTWAHLMLRVALSRLTSVVEQ